MKNNPDSTDMEREKESFKRILILAANPKTTPRLRLDEEVREIEEGLQRAKHRERFDIRSKWAVRFRDLRRALLDYEPHIVHFVGHGEKKGLALEDEVGSPVLISAKALSELFKLFSDQVECVMLGACYSALQAEVINKHIHYVIGMKKEIEDKAAIEFAVGFYDALGAGRSVEKAFEFGCSALQSFHIPVKNFPLLFTNQSNHFQAENTGPHKHPAAPPAQPQADAAAIIHANKIGKVISTAHGDIITNKTIYHYYPEQKENK
jgi:hypothetical protein